MRTILTTLLALWAIAAILAFAFQPEAPACAIQLNQINDLYIGVDNPASILVRGVPEAEIRLETSENLKLENVIRNCQIIAERTSTGARYEHATR